MWYLLWGSLGYSFPCLSCHMVIATITEASEPDSFQRVQDGLEEVVRVVLGLQQSLQAQLPAAN